MPVVTPVLSESPNPLDQPTLPDRIVRALRSTSSLDDLLEGICSRIMAIMEADVFFIALYDRETGQLDYRIHVDRGVRHAPGLRLASGLTGRVIAERKPLLVTNFGSDDGTKAANRGFDAILRPKAWLGVPMMAGDEVLGVIVLQNYRASYSAVDQTILSNIAGEAAALIDKARLVEDLNQAYNDLSTMQAQILQSRNTLRALFDNLADSLYIVDRQYQILAVNQAQAARVRGLPQSLVGHPCHLTFYGEERPCDGCLAEAAFRTGCGDSQSVRQIRGGGNVELETTAYPVSSSDDRVNSVIIMSHDVTERRRIEATLFESAKLSAVGQLAASMAHEISNPLTVITGNVQYLLTEIGPDHPNFELLQLSERAARRANRVIRTLLDFSRQEAYEFVPTNINTCIEDSLSLVSYQLSRSNIAVIKDFGADLPPVIASGSHLQTVWTNLLLNARDAMPRPDGGEIRVGTQRDSVRRRVRVDFSDSGHGIPQDHVNHIFEPFFTTKPVGKGTGLGLYVVHNIIERHGGQIEVSSAPGAGTTFSVWLPISGADLPGETQSSNR